MRALIWIAAILVLLILLLFLLRFRLTAVYGEEGASLTAAIGALPVFRQGFFSYLPEWHE